MRYIMIPTGIKDNFAKRIGLKETVPIEIISIPNKHVLPESVLGVKEFTQAMPSLLGLPLLEKDEIEFIIPEPEI